MDNNSNSGFPSLTALLGLLAVAGYQNRDKIGEWLGGVTNGGANTAPGQAGAPRSEGGVLGNVGGMLGAGGIGGMLGELVDRFKQAGQGEKADSWVRQGPNQEVEAPELETGARPRDDRDADPADRSLPGRIAGAPVARRAAGGRQLDA